MSNKGQSKVVTTRWWWVRHAPVRSDGGNIYGQKDIACDTGDREVFEAVAKILPRQAVWFASSLQRTHQTAQAIWDTGFPKPAAMAKGCSLRRAASRTMAGMNRAAFLASRPAGSHWFADIGEPAPGGESFMDLYNRVRGAIDRITSNMPAGCDRGRPWRHDQGGDWPCARRPAGKGPCLRYRQLFGDAARSLRKHRPSIWRLPMVNQQPWIADPAHKAMHQPAGPEIVPETKLA